MEKKKKTNKKTNTQKKQQIHSTPGVLESKVLFFTILIKSKNLTCQKWQGNDFLKMCQMTLC